MRTIRMVSIILPTYNEAENIIDLIKTIHKQIKSKKEILVIDDNSPDGTSKVVQAFIKKNLSVPVKVYIREKNRGLTNSINDGIKLAQGDVVIWLDCDFSMPPAVIPSLIDKIEAGYDIAKGTRYIMGGGVYHKKGSPDPYLGKYLSKVLNTFARRLLGTTITDYTTGFICSKKHVFSKISLRGDYGEYAPDFFVRAYRQGFTIAEVPFIAPPRVKGESKTGQNPWQYMKRGRKYLWTLGRLIVTR